jgi:hypothetical protein
LTFWQSAHSSLICVLCCLLQVRNAAALTFTALVMRVIGFKNGGNKQLQAKPLQQLAATAPDLNLHVLASSSSAVANCGYSAAASAAAAAAAGRSSWCVKSPTAADFFYRYPQLHVFLLGQLQEAAQLLQQPNAAAAECGASSEPGSQGGHVPPSLFPVLVILSRLKPSLQLSSLGSNSSSTGPAAEAGAANAAAGAAAASPLAPAAFVPSVLAVGRCSVMGVRQIAAASLAPLVAADQLPAMCLELASSLPHDAAAAGHLANQNVLHGILLQLTALLRAVATSNATSGGEGSAPAGSSSSSSAASANVAALVVDLLPAFVGSSWLGGSSSSSSSKASGAVRQAYIAAAGQLVILAYTHWPALLDASCSSSKSSDPILMLQQLVTSLKSACLTAVQQTMPATGSSSSSSAGPVMLEAADPQHCCWLRDWTMMLLGHLLRLEVLLQQQQQQQQQQCTVEAGGYVQELLLQLQQRLLSCTASSSYEVRAAALKAAAVQLDHVLQLMPQLPGLLSSSSTAAAALQQLSSQLWAALEDEKTVKVLKRQLVVLGQLQSLLSWLPAVQAEAGQADAVVLQRLRVALAVGRQYKQLEVRIAALTCAAREVHPAVAAVCQAAAAPAASSSPAAGGLFGKHAADYLQYMHQLLQVLQTCSHYGQQEELRAAAAEALQLSGILRPLAAAATRPTTTSSSSSSGELLAVARLSLSAWSVALRLMEDEEDMVRQPAADATQQVLQMLQPAAALTPAGLSAAASTTSSSGSCGVAADPSSGTGQYVEAVEQSTFVLLSRCSSWWPELLPDVLQLLTGVVFEAGTAVPEVLLQQYRKHEQQAAAAAAAAAAPAADAAAGVLAGVLVRRLFEKEADNHHEEQVLLAQHAAAALQRTLQQAQLPVAAAAAAQASAATAVAEGLISSWSQGLAHYLGDVLSKMSAVSSSTAGGWVGGDTNHPEVFVPLYRCLLGLLATAPWWATASSSSSSEDVQAAGSKAAASAASVVKCSVQCMVGQLLQLQPTVLLVPVLRELQRASSSGDGDAAACMGSTGVLFLTQNQ